ncbi:MAG: TonB-dependent receptor, partial [Caulobacteraceae bacterium]
MAEIVVTAQKREENIEKVPVAVSAYLSKERDIVGIESIQDITNFTPGLSYSTSLDRAFIRGVGRQTNNLSSQPGVATYSDGVYNSSVTAAGGDSLFVDRVEVLRGPQGTLYGRNSIGGTINSISKRPTSTYYAEVRADIGNYGVYNIEGATSGPITDNLRFRLAAYSDNQTEGYYRNLSGGPSEGGRQGSYYFEGQLEGTVGPVDFWLKGDTLGYWSTYRSSNNNAPFDTAPFPIGTLGPGAGFVYNPCFTVSQGTACAASPTGSGIGGTFTQQGHVTQNPGIYNIRDFDTNTPERAHLTDDYNISAQVTWHTPWNADLKYIGGYTHYYYHLTTDFDGTPVQSYTIPAALGPPAVVDPNAPFVYVEDKTYWSNELDLTSRGNAPLQWIVGLYEYHEFFSQPVDFYDPGQPQLATPVNVPSFLPALPDPAHDYYHINQQMKADSLAGFGQFDWKITPTVKFTGGVRFSYDYEGGLESTRQITWGLPAFYGFPAGSLGPLNVLGANTPAVDATTFLIDHNAEVGTIGAAFLD